MTRLHRTILAALVALLLVPTAAVADEPEAKEDAEDKSTFTLVEPGAEPRAVLRYKPVAGSKYDVVLKIAFTMSGGGMEMAFPTILLDTSYEVLAVEENGNFHVRCVVADVTSEGEDTTGMGAMLLGSLDVVRGLAVTGTYCSRGSVISSEISDVEVTDPLQQQMLGTVTGMLNDLGNELPEAPVGPGAKWVRESRTASGMIVMDVKTTYELLKVDGDKVALKVAIEQTADEGQQVEVMGIPALLKKLDGTGSGLYLLDLVATTASFEATTVTEQILSIDMGGGATEMPQSSSMTMSATVKPANAATSAEDEMMKRMIELATPGPFHANLKPLCGTWDSKAVMFKPDGTTSESVGVARNEWILGDRYLKLEYTGDYEGRPFEGGGIIGYDNHKQAYQSLWLDTFGTGFYLTAGTCSDDGKTLTLLGEWDGPFGRVAVKDVYTIEGNDKYVLAGNWKMPGGEWVKKMEITFTRKKTAR